jgi:hypothetical protein
MGEEEVLVTGRIRNSKNGQSYPYTMRILHPLDLPAALALYDVVVDHMEQPDMLWRYADDMVAGFFGAEGIVIGVFVEESLVGFRVVYFHHTGDLSNPLVCMGPSYNEMAHLALCVIRSDFRGNSLQKKMGVELLKVAQATKPFRNLCSVVSPHNYPSINDKFSIHMVVVKLLPKFRGIWRYLFYLNIDTPLQAKMKQLIFVPSCDYPQQIKLLEEGYYGVSLSEDKGEMGMLFRK